MTDERLTTDDVRHIALLARIGMTDDEIELMRDQMSHILRRPADSAWPRRRASPLALAWPA